MIGEYLRNNPKSRIWLCGNELDVGVMNFVLWQYFGTSLFDKVLKNYFRNL